MKKIEAVIRKSKFKLVKKALIENGYDNFSYYLVRNHSEEKETRMYRGVKYEPPSAEKIWLSISVNDEKVEELIKIILENGRTGHVGDGNIFITDLVDVYRIRTGEHGDEAQKL
jgi:nitrogen regulatory protein P-II 1